MNYYLDVLKKYSQFNGRSSRKEFWIFYLYNLLIISILSVIRIVFQIPMLDIITIGITYIFYLFLIIPSLAVTIRRLHDIGRSGWWILLFLIPIIGWIWLLILLALPGNPEDNKYGTNPKLIETKISTALIIILVLISLILISIEISFTFKSGTLTNLPTKQDTNLPTEQNLANMGYKVSLTEKNTSSDNLIAKKNLGVESFQREVFELQNNSGELTLELIKDPNHQYQFMNDCINSPQKIQIENIGDQSCAYQSTKIYIQIYFKKGDYYGWVESAPLDQNPATSLSDLVQIARLLESKI